jgi:hypothetical protein
MEIKEFTDFYEAMDYCGRVNGVFCVHGNKFCVIVPDGSSGEGIA